MDIFKEIFLFLLFIWYFFGGKRSFISGVFNVEVLN